MLKPYFIHDPEKAGVTEAGLRVTWLGHATVMVEMEELIFLTDPMFSSRASPSQYMGPKRFRRPPCTISELPPIDAVLISHNHYDHLDYGSVLALNERFGSDLRWFVPLGLLDWMQKCGCENVIELDWWEENCVPGHDNVTFVFTPSQHWCKRTLLDNNRVLWGSWSVLGSWSRFFFAGDTGYCPAFEEIGKRFGPFDLAAIPIGAYEPRFVHTDVTGYESWYCVICDFSGGLGIHRWKLKLDSYSILYEGIKNLAGQSWLTPFNLMGESKLAWRKKKKNFYTLPEPTHLPAR